MNILKLLSLSLGVLVVLSHSVLMPPALASEVPEVTDIIQKANLASYYSGNDGRAEARMRIVDAQGRKQVRQFTILRKNHTRGGRQDMLVFFSRPSDVRGTVFRVVRHPGSNDDRWLYLPGLDLLERIAAGDQRTSFVGSDFFYEDVSGRDPSADQHQLVENTSDHYVIKSTPKKPGDVEFESYTSWINKESFIPEKVEYRDRKANIYRRMEVLKVEKIQNHATVVHARISNLVRNSSTEMQLRGIQYDVGIPDGVFSERSMRVPPDQWLRSR